MSERKFKIFVQERGKELEEVIKNESELTIDELRMMAAQMIKDFDEKCPELAKPLAFSAICQMMKEIDTDPEERKIKLDRQIQRQDDVIMMSQILASTKKNEA